MSFDEDMLELRDDLLRLAARAEECDKEIEAMRRQGRETDARLKVLADLVERSISGN